MAFSTSFAGTADTVVGSPDFTLAFYTGNNFARLTGSGGLKALANASGQPSWHLRNEAVVDHLVEVEIGSGIVSNSSFKLITLRADTNGFDGYHVYYVSGNLWLGISSSNLVNISQTLVAGDIVRAEAQGNDYRVYVNNVLRLSYNSASGNTRTRTGFSATSSVDTGEVLRSWRTTAYPESDLIAPVLSSPTLVPTSPTTLDAGFTSDEAGTSWTVLTPAAQAAPSEAQIRAGQDATGAAAVDSELNRAMIAGLNSFILTGVSGTAYKAHTISQDGAGTPNVSNIVSSGSATPPIPALKANVTLYAENGTTPKASVTGLQWAWWDDATPDLSLAPDISGTGASTSAGGVFDVTLTGTTLTLGQTGTLLVYKTDGTAGSTATLAFCGPLVTVN